MTTISIYDICRCGDYRSQHLPNGGKCGVCGDGTYPDGCKRFRFAFPAEAAAIHGTIHSMDGHERRLGEERGEE